MENIENKWHFEDLQKHNPKSNQPFDRKRNRAGKPTFSSARYPTVLRHHKEFRDLTSSDQRRLSGASEMHIVTKFLRHAARVAIIVLIIIHFSIAPFTYMH